ncbi:MAG TPA: hypothetical protein VEZ12_03845, partial [Herpetosiphonaceae bacterium]|nr:hypothetical protein [Herpetosiphonaceae bacterium]
MFIEDRHAVRDGAICLAKWCRRTPPVTSIVIVVLAAILRRWPVGNGADDGWLLGIDADDGWLVGIGADDRCLGIAVKHVDG